METFRKICSWLHVEIQGVHNAALLVSAFTLGAQVMALLRDRILAHMFGAGDMLDAFYASFRIPDMLYVFIASMVSVFVLIPFLDEASKDGREKVQHLLSSVFTVFGGALLLVGGVVALYAETVVGVLYGGFPVAQQQIVVDFVRVLMIQPILLGVSGVLSAYVQKSGRFVIYSTAPILYNLGIIFGVGVLYPAMGPIGLAWGVVCGALLHMLIQMPFLLSEKVFPRVVVPDWGQMVRIVRISLPRSLTLASSQLSMLVLVVLGSGLVSGSIAVFTFAYNMQSVPLSLIAVSYSVVAFPALASLQASGESVRFLALLRSSLRKIVLWSLLAMALFIVLRAQIVRVLLGTGAFDWNDTLLTGATLAVFVFSLIAQGVSLLLVRSCYAVGRTVMPFVGSVVQFLVTIGTAMVSLQVLTNSASITMHVAELLRVAHTDAVFVIALAFGYSVGAYVHVLYMLVYAKRLHSMILNSFWRPFFQMVCASVVAGVATYTGLAIAGAIVTLDTFWAVLLQGVVGGVCGVVAWAGTLYLLKNKDIVAVYNAVRALCVRG